MQARRHAPRRAHQARRVRARRDAHEHALARVPRLLDAVRGLVAAHLRLDALGGAAQRELAQRDEVALAEEVLDGARRLLRDVDLALVQALEQLVDGQVDDAHLVRLVEDRVGHRLADDDAGDLRDHVVEALEVLHVERREDVDARVEQLLDVLPALEVARARARWCARARRRGGAAACARAPRRGRTPRA